MFDQTFHISGLGFYSVIILYCPGGHLRCNLNKWAIQSLSVYGSS